jgi:methionine-rich copper-binding protein CopC
VPGDFRFRRSYWLRLGAILAISILPGILHAHALLEESTPAAGSTVGPKLEIKLRFNTRIDGKRSQLELITPLGKSQPVALESQDSPQIVSAHVALSDGAYRLRWQVLAVDGHITRGEIPFNVK